MAREQEKTCDELLKKYFTGYLDLEIKQKEMQLRHLWASDENMGGGRAQNKFSYAFSDPVAHEDEKEAMLNELLADLIDLKQLITDWVSTFNDEFKQILVLRYRESRTWTQISIEMNLSEKTVRRAGGRIRELFVGVLANDVVHGGLMMA